MGVNYIYRVCLECRGDGIITMTNRDGVGDPTETDVPCPNCQDGLVLWGELRDELIDEE
jgi:hypothetical protein